MLNQSHDKLNNSVATNKNDNSITIRDELVVSEKPNKKASLAILIFACFACFGDLYCYDIPQSLQSILMDQLQLSVLEFNLFYSVYCLFNVILPFVGGVLINRLGLRSASMIFGSLVLIGQCVSTYGAYTLNFGYMLIGRAIYALGGDSIVVCKSTMISKWFMGKRLSLALGIGLCIARLGSSANSLASPAIFNLTQNLWAPYAAGSAFCLLSWLSVVAMNYLDHKHSYGNIDYDNGELSNHVRWKDLKGFKMIYYLLLFNCFLLYSGFFGLTNNINNLMDQRFGFTPQSAGNIIPIMYLCTVIVIPIVGALSDKKGRRVIIILVACLIMLVDHLVIAFLPDSPDQPEYAFIGVLFGSGIFYSIYTAAYWPCIALVSDEKLIGISYGIVLSFQNLVLSIVPLVLGYVHDNTSQVHSGYFWTEIILAGLIGLGVIVTVAIYYEDKKDGKLQKPSKCERRSRIDTQQY